MVLIQKKLYFSKDPWGWGTTFSREGPNTNFYRNPNNL